MPMLKNKLRSKISERIAVSIKPFHSNVFSNQNERIYKIKFDFAKVDSITFEDETFE